MYLASLKNINQTNLIGQQEKLNDQVIKDFSELLSLIRVRETISPQYIAYELDIPLQIVNKFFIALAELKILDTKFIIKCDNDEFANVHDFMFGSYKELIAFVQENQFFCPTCESDLLEENTKVLFIKPPNLS